jgi:hypothetical protein
VTAVRAALAQVERCLSALPYLRRLRALRTELGTYDLGDVPAGQLAFSHGRTGARGGGNRRPRGTSGTGERELLFR